MPSIPGLALTRVRRCGSCSGSRTTVAAISPCSCRRPRTCSAPASPSTERRFSYAEALLLFAVLLARQAGKAVSSEQLARRLRTLRNIAESASLDSTRMAEYVGTTERLILSGTLDGAQAFHQEWTADEQAKWDVMDAHPEVTKYFHLLEDNITLRGRLFALDIENVAAIPARATAFSLLLDPALRGRLGAALLTKADYSRDVGWNGTRRQLGSSQRDDSWRDLFTAGSRAIVQRVRGSADGTTRRRQRATRVRNVERWRCTRRDPL